MDEASLGPTHRIFGDKGLFSELGHVEMKQSPDFTISSKGGYSLFLLEKKIH